MNNRLEIKRGQRRVFNCRIAAHVLEGEYRTHSGQTVTVIECHSAWDGVMHTILAEDGWEGLAMACELDEEVVLNTTRADKLMEGRSPVLATIRGQRGEIKTLKQKVLLRDATISAIKDALGIERQKYSALLTRNAVLETKLREADCKYAKAYIDGGNAALQDAGNDATRSYINGWNAALKQVKCEVDEISKREVR